VANVEFPKRPDQANGLSDTLQLKPLLTCIEAHLGRGGDQAVPAKVVGRYERAGIGEIASRKTRHGFLPIERSSRGRQMEKDRD